MKIDLYSIILISIIVITGIYSSLTDLKNNKIYNKMLLKAILFGGIIQVGNIIRLIIMNRLNINNLAVLMLSFLVGVIGSFLLYKNELWAAGDSKLFTVLLMMLPIQYILDAKYFFTIDFNILLTIFCIAYIWIIFETIYLLFNDINKGKFITILKENFSIEKRFLFLNYFKNFTSRYLFIYFFILNLNNIMMNSFLEFYKYNRAIFMLLNIFAITKILNIIKDKKMLSISTIILIMYTGIDIYINKKVEKFSYAINYTYLLLIIVVIAFRYLGTLYNYKQVMVKDLKQGMILSFTTIVKFQNSRVKGLPKITYENTKSRLSEDEVDSIIRWSKSKYGQDFVIIVRHIPFAPFIFLGFLFQIVIKYFY